MTDIRTQSKEQQVRWMLAVAKGHGLHAWIATDRKSIGVEDEVTLATGEVEIESKIIYTPQELHDYLGY